MAGRRPVLPSRRHQACCRPHADATRAGDELADRLSDAATRDRMLVLGSHRLTHNKRLADEACDVIAGECPGRLESRQGEDDEVSGRVLKVILSSREDTQRGDTGQEGAGQSGVCPVGWPRGDIRHCRTMPESRETNHRPTGGPKTATTPSTSTSNARVASPLDGACSQIELCRGSSLTNEAERASSRFVVGV